MQWCTRLVASQTYQQDPWLARHSQSVMFLLVSMDTKYGSQKHMDLVYNHNTGSPHGVQGFHHSEDCIPLALLMGYNPLCGEIPVHHSENLCNGIVSELFEHLCQWEGFILENKICSL